MTSSRGEKGKTRDPSICMQISTSQPLIEIPTLNSRAPTVQFTRSILWASLPSHPTHYFETIGTPDFYSIAFGVVSLSDFDNMAFAFAPASSFAGMAVRGSVQVTSPRPVRAARFTMSGGKGFGGGEVSP